MTDLAMLFVAAWISVWAVILWWKDTFFKSVVAALCALFFGAGFLQTLVPARFALAIIAILGIVCCLVKFRRTLGPRTRMLAVAGPTICLLTFGLLQAVVAADVMDPLFRYTVLFPIMLILGFIMSKVDKDNITVRTFLYVAVFMAVLAVLERIQGSFFVAGNYENADRLVRDGAIRSIVGAEHPLVLSVLLVASIPLVQMTLHRRAWQLMAYSLLLAGIVSTNSRGALALAALWFVLSVALKTQLLKRAGSFAIRALALAAAGTGIIWLLAGTGSESLSSTTAVDASAEYRSVLYTFAWRSLTEHPLGWGLAGLPEGVYVVASYFGSLDVATTVDSEIALAIFDFGWIGVAGVVGLGVFLFKSQRIRSPIGQSALLISASGFYLALHSWTGLGSAWFLLLGLCISFPEQPTEKEEIPGAATLRPSLLPSTRQEPNRG